MQTAVIDPSIAWKYRIVPSSEEDDTLVLLHDGSREEKQLKDELSFLLERRVVLKKCSADDLSRTLHQLYRRPGDESVSSDWLTGLQMEKEKLKEKDEQKEKQKEKQKEMEGTVRGHTQFSISDPGSLEQIVLDAINIKASDIHIENDGDTGRIRYRIDGKLLERSRITTREYPALVNRIKVRANMSISEKRVPQDGRCMVELHGQKINMRVSVMPSVNYEIIVIRILGNRNQPPLISELGLSEAQTIQICSSLLKLQGLILISGPTGSGKTSTLYACLNEMNTTQRNILTIEDPVEITMNGINQVQVRPEVGLGFSDALRAFLRQDPDVIMIGEIRDKETAEMAIRASMTGHLVISTIHTNSAWESISRLTDLGIPPYLISSTLSLSIAQRLVRILCPKCKKRKESPGILTSRASGSASALYEKGDGCLHCNMTGYNGRTACFELIEIDREARQLIASGKIERSFRPLSPPTLKDSVLNLLNNGITSEEEAFPVIAISND